MPKHVTLGLTMRHMTGSSSIIGISNGLRHSVSHSAVLEHDTALAYKQLCTDNIVPEGFIKKIPTTVIWNNNDFMEETPSGEGTTHNTNGFLVQRIGCVDDGTESISCIDSESKHLPKKTKNAPLTLLQTSWRCTTKGNDKVRSPLTIKMSYMNTLQMNTLLNSTTIPPLSKLGYLPVIDASTTIMDTVYTILTQSVAIALDRLVLVIDQGIYSKSQQIRWQND